MALNVFNYECEGQLSLFDTEKRPYRIKKPIRLIELFAGIGSQAMALRDIGANFEHYRVVEFDKYAIASYNAIHGTNFEPTDITKINGSDLGIKDTDKYCYIVTYSFPCQDLSVAGLQRGMDKGSGTRSGLLWEVERLLNEVEELPQILLMENVPNVHGKQNIENFKKWQNALEWMGYKNYWQDLNAVDYGVAQSRKRCFMVSVLGNKSYEFPKPIPLDKCMKDYLEDEVDEKYYIKSDKAKELIDKLIVGGKILTDRQTDRQLTYASNMARPSKSVMPSQLDMMQVYANTNMSTQEYAKCCCLNSKGGRGGVENLQPSVQDRVYDPNGASVAITTSYMPKIIEVKKVES